MELNPLFFGPYAARVHGSMIAKRFDIAESSLRKWLSLQPKSHRSMATAKRWKRPLSGWNNLLKIEILYQTIQALCAIDNTYEDFVPSNFEEMSFPEVVKK